MFRDSCRNVQVNIRLPDLPWGFDNQIQEKEELGVQYEYLLDHMLKAKVFAAVVSLVRATGKENN